MNGQRLWALIRKDWKELARNSQALAPMVIVPLIFCVIMPIVVLTLGQNPEVASQIQGMAAFLQALPEGILPAGATEQQQMVYAVVVYFFAPFFLLIPLMVASVIGSSSFVGEKERRTIEGLLYTPLTDRELVLGKILAALVPSVAVSWLAFVVYAVIVNSVGGPLFGGLFFPTPTWLLMMLVLVPLMGFLGVSLIVAVSQRAKTMQSAQGSAVFLVLPIVALVISQSTGAVLFGTPVVALMSLLVAIADLVIFLLVVRHFGRERILTRL